MDTARTLKLVGDQLIYRSCGSHIALGSLRVPHKGMLKLVLDETPNYRPLNFLSTKYPRHKVEEGRTFRGIQLENSIHNGRVPVRSLGGTMRPIDNAIS